MAASEIVVANTSFASSFLDGEVDDKGNPTFYTLSVVKGQKYRANHPMVKQARNYFDSDDGTTPVIEAATAAPGELRGA